MIALQNIKFAPNTCIFWEGKLRLVVQRVVKKKKKRLVKHYIYQMTSLEYAPPIQSCFCTDI